MYNLGYGESFRKIFREIDILTYVSQYIHKNLMYIRKNINGFTNHFYKK